MNSPYRKTTVYKVPPPFKKLLHKQGFRVAPYRKVSVLENALVLGEQPRKKQNQQLTMIKGRLLTLYLYLFELIYILSK